MNETNTPSVGLEPRPGDGQSSTSGATDWPVDSEPLPNAQPGSADDSAATVQPPAANIPAPDTLEGIATGPIGEGIASLQKRLDGIEESIGALSKQISYLPPQVRTLGGKVDGLTTSISEPRFRNVLLSLLGIYDLVDQLWRGLPDADEKASDHKRSYDVLRTQLRQILETNGLTEIPTSGAFDPLFHRAIKRVTTSDPAQEGSILEVVRPGFCTPQAVLRYAEVVVGAYQPPDPAIAPGRAEAGGEG
jgi:hypothetical protein